MRNLTFQEAQLELEKQLAVLKGSKVNKIGLNTEAQKIVTDFFRKCKARSQPVLIETSGIEIVGCELAFNGGMLGVKRWLTAFWPSDVNQVSRLEPSAIALGYVNGNQLYVLPPKSEEEPAKLVARVDMGPNFGTWSPTIQGMPQTNSVFFVCLERARNLGYLPLFQQVEN